MSFYTVIYSSLGMSASWEIHEKVVKITEICWFFSGGRWEWTWAPFRVDFRTILGACGCPKSEKRRSRNLKEKQWKKETQDFPANSE